MLIKYFSVCECNKIQNAWRDEVHQGALSLKAVIYQVAGTVGTELSIDSVQMKIIFDTRECGVSYET